MGMKHEIHHGLSLELAKKAIDKAMEAYSARFADYSPSFDWTSETKASLGFKARGVTVAGEIEIAGPKVLVDLEVPLLLRIFKGRAMDVIDQEVKKWIEKARAGELD